MADNPRNPIADTLVYWIVAIAQWLIQCLPLRWAQRLGAVVGAVIGRIDRRHFQRVLDQMHMAFPEWDEKKLYLTARAHYRHLGMLGVELLWMPRMAHVKNWQDYIHGDPLVLDDIKASHGGGIVAMGHIGNWEIGAIVASAVNHSLHSVARPLKNPKLDRLLVRSREFLKQKIIPKKGALLGIRRALDHGFVAMIIDQNVREGGFFVDFFGRKASTIAVVGKLAVKAGKPVLVYSTQRMPKTGRFEAILEELIDPIKVIEEVGKQEAPLVITQRFTAAMEKAIRRYPEQWLWTHKRWKTRPPEEMEEQQEKALPQSPAAADSASGA